MRLNDVVNRLCMPVVRPVVGGLAAVAVVGYVLLSSGPVVQGAHQPNAQDAHHVVQAVPTAEYRIFMPVVQNVFDPLNPPTPTYTPPPPPTATNTPTPPPPTPTNTPTPPPPTPTNTPTPPPPTPTNTPTPPPPTPTPQYLPFLSANFNCPDLTTPRILANYGASYSQNGSPMTLDGIVYGTIVSPSNNAVVAGSAGIIESVTQLASDKWEIVVTVGIHNGRYFAVRLITGEPLVSQGGTVTDGSLMAKPYADLSRLFNIPALVGKNGTFMRLEDRGVDNNIAVIVNSWNANGFQYLSGTYPDMPGCSP